REPRAARGLRALHLRVVRPRVPRGVPAPAARATRRRVAAPRGGVGARGLGHAHLARLAGDRNAPVAGAPATARQRARESRRMTQDFRPCAVIPTYDTPATVRRVVETVRAHLADVVLVDDGSGPEGRAAVDAIARDGLAHVERRARNGGKWAAVKSGFT